MSYQSDTQKLKTKKVKEHSSIVDEKLLAERVYYGDQTHVYVGYLRAFKSGYFEGTKIRKITDIAKLLVASENFTKRARGEQKPLTYSTIITELEKVWADVYKRQQNCSSITCEHFMGSLTSTMLFLSTDSLRLFITFW